MRTADLIDDYADSLAFMHLPFRQYGLKKQFFGPVQTVKCFEDNSALREQLESPGDGRVLVVDGGGSTRIALLGDKMASLAIKNGWSGLVLNAAIRDSVEIGQMDISVFALGTSPVKSAKKHWGEAGVPLSIGGVHLNPGAWLYADADGVLVSEHEIAGLG